MSVNLKNRSFLKLLDFTPEEIQYFLDLAAELKQAKREGRERKTMVGKNIVGCLQDFKCLFGVCGRNLGKTSCIENGKYAQK